MKVCAYLLFCWIIGSNYVEAFIVLWHMQSVVGREQHYVPKRFTEKKMETQTRPTLSYSISVNSIQNSCPVGAGCAHLILSFLSWLLFWKNDWVCQHCLPSLHYYLPSAVMGGISYAQRLISRAVAFNKAHILTSFPFNQPWSKTKAAQHAALA